MRQLGRSHSYREPILLERLASWLRVPLAHVPFPTALRRGYAAMLERVAADRLLCRFPHGETVRVSAEFRQMTWNPDEYEAFRADAHPGDIVLDVGANVGAYSVLFAQWVGARGHVLAFEPADAARRGLNAHVVLNGVAERVTVRSEAVSAREGVGWFKSDAAAGRLVDESHAAAPVRTTSIDAVCREAGIRPTFIKVDVEGAELDVLRGARETIAAAGADLKLYVEMHPHLWPARGVSRDDVEAELSRQRLRPERLDGDADVWAIDGVCLRLRRCES